ncbi:hypothetical protein ACUOCP_13705, partial [Escherichia sp. R-CC3]
MDRIIEKLDHGWWVVSHEQKLWLPKGELPYGEAANFDLVGQRALQIGEWQGEPVWLVQQQRRHDMRSVKLRQLYASSGQLKQPNIEIND